MTAGVTIASFIIQSLCPVSCAIEVQVVTNTDTDKRTFRMAWQPLMSYGNIVDLWWVTFHLSMLTGLFKSTIRYWGFNWWAENVNHCQGLPQVTGKHWLIIAIDDISHTGQYNFNLMLYWVKRVRTNFSLAFCSAAICCFFSDCDWLGCWRFSFFPDIVTCCSD